MKRAEIIAELRRSAVEDCDPWCDMAQSAHDAVYRFWHPVDLVPPNTKQDRPFFLIIAEAMG